MSLGKPGKAAALDDPEAGRPILNEYPIATRIWERYVRIFRKTGLFSLRQEYVRPPRKKEDYECRQKVKK